MQLLLRSLVLLVVTASCAAPPAQRDPFAGVYPIGGGDGALPNVQALADAFMKLHPGVKFEFNTSLGSGGAVNLAADGSLDLGMVSRDMSPSETQLVESVGVGVAGTGLVVHQGNPVKDLTTAQVRAIFSGQQTDWASVGGEKLNIIPLVREQGSSARAAFESYIFDGKATYSPNILEVQGGAQMRQSVAGQRGAIGMIGVKTDDPAAPGVHLISIEGVAPTQTALRDGTYKIRRPLYLVYSRRILPKPAMVEFLAFIRGPDGQRIIDRF